MIAIHPCRSIEIARAKVNLSLTVLFRRQDGYHELTGLMATTGLADRLHLSLEGAVKPGHSWEITVDAGNLPAGEGNLCHKAARLFFEAAGIDPASIIFVCRLEKKIPTAAGLGGGSADAAAVLRFLWRSWWQGLAQSLRIDPGRLTRDSLERIALACGADVPFCLQGGIRFCEGVGERMSPSIASPAYPLLLALPPLEIRTANAFSLLDESRQAGAGQRVSDRQPAALSKWVEVLEKDDRPALGVMVQNDFLEIHEGRASDIPLIIRDLRRAGAFAASMTGSGPACFGLFESQAEMKRAREILTVKHPAISWIMTALSPSTEDLIR
ncbi:MAG TPA: 4-(cytidine 5'-diphospho)-2-C-methyl-D-erythritol kinase [Bacillota bacterium]|mgnify:CR=1 FL=1|nr:4-(cytidine 5'-diphospho)-2-C-methyl-D-erythritol kinase [Fastidiosipila sp.]HPX93469.1 4-(cytidine 5'-diphospho)-2-C-methyl-D-erythritol kinase [Bacillota bacterium]HQB81240.1 4-(cytidine 5'-diphospho)-2-C-methyl-D-erythritol kinase [Bacillota bacterium]